MYVILLWRSVHYNYYYVKCIALWGEPGAMIDGCIHLPLMTLHAIIINDKHNTSYVLSVYKQQCGYMNRSMHGILETCTDMS